MNNVIDYKVDVQAVVYFEHNDQPSVWAANIIASAGKPGMHFLYINCIEI